MAKKIKKLLGKQKKTKPGRQAPGAASCPDLFQQALNLHLADRVAEAAALYRQIPPAHPTYPEATNNLGNIFLAQGNLREAEACFRRAITVKPAYPEAHNNLGVTLEKQERLEEATDSYRQAIGLNPDYAEAYYGLSALLLAQDQPEEAETGFLRALDLKPNLVDAYYNLGDLYLEQGRLQEAEVSCCRVLALVPEDIEAHILLGRILKEQGRQEEAVRVLQAAGTLKPGPASAQAHSNLLLNLNYLPGLQEKEIYDKSRQYDKYLGGVPLAENFAPTNGKEPGHRLRIGYVSADFRSHSVAYFVEPLLRAHNREQVEIYCYANVKKPDERTSRLQDAADHWRSILGMSNHEAVATIRRDRIDILVDLGGHTGSNNLLLFACKSAPIQVTWLGYPNTTGLKNMDYRFTDAIVDPPGEADRWHTEKLVRLEHGFLCYQPEADTPAVEPPPCLEQGLVTFGSFNNLAKVNPEVVKVWAAILHQEPNSRLLLKSKPLAHEETRQRYRQLFADHGITAERLLMGGWLVGKNDHLGLYHSIDIGLDPFPYNGTTTTCEALWMGVPVVTLSGERHAARVGANILHRVGLEELVAPTKEAYQEKALALARDRRRLQTLRSELRQRLRDSPLLNAPLFAATVEDAYRRMWRQWCET